jgi:D-serine deaminase-like pyridoxal phosphate-dependent protein
MNESTTRCLAIDPAWYALVDTKDLLTPSVVVYPELVQANIARAIAWAGGEPSRLRPHAKTHKTVEVTRMQLDLGIRKQKCATLFEADMLARAGVPDILIGYPMVGPNIGRLAELIARYGDRSRFSVLVDHPQLAESLGTFLREKKLSVGVLIDVDGGMGRTGISPGRPLADLARQVMGCSALRFDGLHLYDGDVDSPSPGERLERVERAYEGLEREAGELSRVGVAVAKMVVAGTGTFAAWLQVAKEEPRLEASPGTFVFSDWNYHQRFADLEMIPAAVLFTRVVSRPRENRLTCDLGHKAVAADPAPEKRVHFLDLADWMFVRQNEEHLVVDSPNADRYAPGDVLMALPYHICPTCALHRSMYVARGGRVMGQWQVAGRDREWSSLD